MTPQAALGISVLFSFLAWGTVSVIYIGSPTNVPRPLAVRALLTLHAFRFVGLAFIVPGVGAQSFHLHSRVQTPMATSVQRSLPSSTLWVIPKNGCISCRHGR